MRRTTRDVAHGRSTGRYREERLATPCKRLETSWRVHYLWNSRNDAPPFASGVRSVQVGQAIHFNATLGYKLSHGLWLGANGYYLKQITSPQINGMSLIDSPEQVGAIGRGVYGI